MKRILITLIAAGTLAVPAGLALAQADTPEPTEPAPTCEQHEHARERVTQQDPAAPQGQHRAEYQNHDGDGTCDGDCTGDQIRDRDQIRLEDGTRDQVQNRNQIRLGDGTGDQVQYRTSTGAADGTSPGPGPGNG